ncbi:MAG: hypothetical protein QM638_00250 [Nocardioides sp.]|uniref:hypothetical protein n=1 Tax=Nocardioides sp. TaxID=35761 RepID=UPI0039E2313F
MVDLADVPVHMPDVAAASKDNFTGAWNCPGGNTPFLTFSTGNEPSTDASPLYVQSGIITVSFEDGWGDVDVDSKWKDMLSSYGEGRIEDVDGHSALVIPPGPSPLGMVMVVVDGVLYQVLGDGEVSVDRLLEVELSAVTAPALPRSSESSSASPSPSAT